METTKQLQDIIQSWKADKKNYVKKSSYAAYALLIENHILPHFGELNDITEAQVQSYVLQKLNDGLSQKTVKDILITLKMILKYAVKQGWIAPITLDIQFPTLHKQHQIEVLTLTHQKKIMNHTKEHFNFRNLGIYMCLSTGMRIGEICAITWDDIDISNAVIKVNKTIQRIYSIENNVRKTELILDTPKTKNSIREIPISRDLMKMIKPFKNIVNPSYYILTNGERPTEPRTYRNYFNKLIQQLELPSMKFHTLRHSFATRCIESKCDYKTVSVLLGHSNISTTLNLYVHPNMEQKKKAINQMFRALQ